MANEQAPNSAIKKATGTLGFGVLTEPCLGTVPTKFFPLTMPRSPPEPPPADWWDGEAKSTSALPSLWDERCSVCSTCVLHLRHPSVLHLLELPLPARCSTKWQACRSITSSYLWRYLFYSCSVKDWVPCLVDGYILRAATACIWQTMLQTSYPNRCMISHFCCNVQTLNGGIHSTDKKSQLPFSSHDITGTLYALPPALPVRWCKNHFVFIWHWCL